MPVGTWNVTVEAPGFKKFTSLKNIVEVAQTIRVDAKLEVGASTETVAVEADAVAIRTEDADITTTVCNQTVCRTAHSMVERLLRKPGSAQSAFRRADYCPA